jgi:hypothetical protein
MIHLRIDRHHPNSIDIYVNIANSSVDQRSSTPKPSSSSQADQMIDDDHIYDHLFDPRVCNRTCLSTIVSNRSTSNSSLYKKNYTLQQILDNVETIQGHYERVLKHRRTTLTCLSTFKQLSKVLKKLRALKTPPSKPYQTPIVFDQPSPFVFGGETFHWIAMPHDNQHIYENELLL